MLFICYLYVFYIIVLSQYGIDFKIYININKIIIILHKMVTFYCYLSYIDISDIILKEPLDERTDN